MDTTTIREAVLKRPFVPFTLRMKDGREFFIRSPEYLAVSPRVVVAIDAATEAGVHLEPERIDTLSFLSLNKRTGS